MLHNVGTLQMTFDDDMLRVSTPKGNRDFTLKALRLSWPPPLQQTFWGQPYKRISCSEITDEQRKDMTHVVRGARYILKEK